MSRGWSGAKGASRSMSRVCWPRSVIRQGRSKCPLRGSLRTLPIAHQMSARHLTPDPADRCCSLGAREPYSVHDTSCQLRASFLKGPHSKTTNRDQMCRAGIEATCREIRHAVRGQGRIRIAAIRARTCCQIGSVAEGASTPPPQSPFSPELHGSGHRVLPNQRQAGAVEVVACHLLE